MKTQVPLGRLVRQAAFKWHSLLANNETATRLYVASVACLARAMPPRIRDLMEWAITGQGVRWQNVAFRPRRVLVGDTTPVVIRPHLGEVDQSVLFRSHFGSDAHVLSWLEINAPKRYDAVIDIGANFGLYSLFFNSLIAKNPDAPLRRVYAFEPSRAAYARLVANLELNAPRAVAAFCVAVADTSEVVEFYQPEGHLVNGSLSRNFAGLFNAAVSSEDVVTLSASALATLFQRHARLLVKIDAEGYEPRIIAALEPLLHRHQPDLLIEVLAGVDEELNSVACLADYAAFHMLPTGPVRRQRIAADTSERDWLLTMSPVGIEDRASPRTATAPSGA